MNSKENIYISWSKKDRGTSGLKHVFVCDTARWPIIEVSLQVCDENTQKNENARYHHFKLASFFSSLLFSPTSQFWFWSPIYFVADKKRWEEEEREDRKRGGWGGEDGRGRDRTGGSGASFFKHFGESSFSPRRLDLKVFFMIKVWVKVACFPPGRAGFMVNFFYSFALFFFNGAIRKS